MKGREQDSEASESLSRIVFKQSLTIEVMFRPQQASTTIQSCLDPSSVDSGITEAQTV